MSAGGGAFTKKAHAAERRPGRASRMLRCGAIVFTAYNGRVRPTPSLCLLVALGPACTVHGTVGVVADETEATHGSDGDDAPRPDTDGVLLDLGGGGIAACSDRGNPMGVGPCAHQAPPDAFEAVLQWSWTGPDGDTDALVIPLVANITDDDANGRIDLCDTPDVLVVAGQSPSLPLSQGLPPAHLYALDGATGALHWVGAPAIRAAVTPALADIDGDSVVEIVALAPAGVQDLPPWSSRLVAFEADGSLAWVGPDAFDSTAADAVALADLDADGDAEIMVADRVFDHEGRLLFVAAEVGPIADDPLMPWAVDLDRDDDLEVLWGRAAYHHDGTPLYTDAALRHGYAHVADFDQDGEPEIVVTTAEGLAVLDPDGTPRLLDVRPVDIPGGIEAWRRPAAIHDIDGDRRPELLMSVGDSFLALRLDLARATVEPLWSAPVVDNLGAAAGTAFDFLGDGTAEAIYADERRLFAFDALGQVVLATDRSSLTLQEYPVVADVDNDGSAEVLVGSNVGTNGATAPTLMVFGEAGDRWVQARRIWNQHAYHVTNVTEDGLLPAPEPRHWLRTNTFRTNAQLEGGVICVPEP
jgi:FG-GAP-like repeat